MKFESLIRSATLVALVLAAFPGACGGTTIGSEGGQPVGTGATDGAGPYTGGTQHSDAAWIPAGSAGVHVDGSVPTGGMHGDGSYPYGTGASDGADGLFWHTDGQNDGAWYGDGNGWVSDGTSWDGNGWVADGTSSDGAWYGDGWQGDGAAPWTGFGGQGGVAGQTGAHAGEAGSAAPTGLGGQGGAHAGAAGAATP